MRLRLYRPLSLATLLLIFCQTAQAQDFYQQALAFHRNGELPAAVIQLKNLLSEQPDHGKGRLLLAELYLQLGQVSGAEKELRRAEQLKVASARLPLLQARLQLVQGHYEAARQALTAQTFETPELDAERRLLLGKAYTALGRFAEAERAFASAEVLAPAARTRLHLARLALLQQQPEVAIERAEEELAQEGLELEARAIIAEAHLQQRDGVAALREFEMVLARRPGQPVALLGKAKAELVLGELAGARETLDQLLALAPDYADAVRLSAALYLRTGEARSAKRLLEPLGQRLGPNAEVGYLSAYANLLLGNPDLAEQQWLRNLAVDPEHRPSRLALTRLLLQQRRLSEARSHLAPLLQNEPRDGQVLALAGAISLKAGEAGEAADYFRQALSRNDELALTGPLALSELLSGETGAGVARLESLGDEKASLQADILLLKGYLVADQSAKARALIQRRLQSRFETLPYRLLGALLENRLGQPQAARGHLRAVLSRDPRSLPALLALAQLARGEQDTAAARQWYDRALSAAPEDIRPVRGKVQLLLAEEDREGAERLAARFYGANRDSAQAAALYLALLRQLQRPEALRAQLEEVMANHPGEPAFRLQRIKLDLAREPDPDKGLLQLEQLLVEHPGYIPAQAARIQLMLGQQRAQQALALIETLPPSTQYAREIALMHGDALRALGRLDEAVAVYRQVIERQPGSVVAWNNLAWLYHEQDDPRARHAAEQAYRLAPQSAAVQDTLGWILLDRERRQALALLAEAARARPNDPSIRYHYAAALVLNERAREAEDLLDPLDKVEFAEKADALRLLNQLRTLASAPSN